MVGLALETKINFQEEKHFCKTSERYALYCYILHPRLSLLLYLSISLSALSLSVSLSVTLSFSLSLSLSFSFSFSLSVYESYLCFHSHLTKLMNIYLL
jgi:hypothetical protein